MSLEAGECPKCPDAHPRCHKHRRRKAGTTLTAPLHPCGKVPLKGVHYCDRHGGDSPRSIAYREQKNAREEAIKLMLTLGDELTDDMDPSEVILEQIRWRRAHVNYLRVKVQELADEALVWGKTKEGTAGQNAGTTYEAKPNAWEALYREYSAALEKLCLDAIRIGIEERKVRVTEKDQAEGVLTLEAVARALGHDPSDPATAQIIFEALRKLNEG